MRALSWLIGASVELDTRSELFSHINQIMIGIRVVSSIIMIVRLTLEE